MHGYFYKRNTKWYTGQAKTRVQLKLESFLPMSVNLLNTAVEQLEIFHCYANDHRYCGKNSLLCSAHTSMYETS